MLLFLPGAVSRAGDYLTVTEETTAGQVTWVSRETQHEPCPHLNKVYLFTLFKRIYFHAAVPVCAASSRMTFTLPSLPLRL